MNRISHLLYILVIAVLAFLLLRPRPADYMAFQEALTEKTGHYGNLRWLGKEI